MSGKNTLFLDRQIIDGSYQKSKMRYNRDYLISPRIAQIFNTYNYFGVFQTNNDIYLRKINSDGTEDLSNTGPRSPGVRSLFNRSAAVMTGGDVAALGTDAADKLRRTSSEIRLFNNAPLMDSPETRRKLREHGACTVRDLVEASKGSLGRAIYSYADFMYCKYLGRVPNNYLITLRRFPVPPGDNITDVCLDEKTKSDAGDNKTMSQIGCLVTWLGTPGNELENILNYSVSMPYEEKTATVQDASVDADSSEGGLFNQIAAVFDQGYRKQYQAGYGGELFNKFVSRFYKPLGNTMIKGPYQVHLDGNKIWGPIDRVKKIYRRGEGGIDFEHSFTLKFEYELRSYNGVNTRQAFLDLLANILSVTYTTGSFWGGGYRGAGMHQNSIFNNLNIFKARGGFTNFIDAFRKDVETLSGPVKETANNIISGAVNLADVWKKSNGVIEGIGNVAMALMKSLGANSGIGMLLSGLLNKAGRPARAFTDSLLSERPVGMWHVMIGNPKHPIMSMGNMILKKTKITHSGPLGLDDFPTHITVECTLDRGKGRDCRDIESLYMHGNDRIYSSMSEKVLDIYSQASGYKSSNLKYNEKTGGTLHKTASNIRKPKKRDSSSVITIDDVVEAAQNKFEEIGDHINEFTDKYQEFHNDHIAQGENVVSSHFHALSDTLKSYFGTDDPYSLRFAASEQENGATRNPPTPKKA